MIKITIKLSINLTYMVNYLRAMNVNMTSMKTLLILYRKIPSEKQKLPTLTNMIKTEI